MAEGVSLSTLETRVVRLRAILSYGVLHGWIDDQRFPLLRRPTAVSLRRERAARGSKAFPIGDVRKLLETSKSEPRMYAAVLMAVYLGYGPLDVSSARREHLHGEFMIFHRQKTGIDRKAWAPPELTAMIKAGILPIRSRRGYPLVEYYRSGRYGESTRNRLSEDFKELCKRAGVNPRGFYSLRHSCAQIGQVADDPSCTASVLGHLDTSMTAVYFGAVTDERLRRWGVRVWNAINTVADDPDRGEAEQELLERLGLREPEEG